MTLHRSLDWLILTNLAILVGFSVFALGGYRDEQRVIITILVGVLVMLHGAWMVTLEERPLRLHGTALILVPFLIYAAINTFTISPVEWLGRRELILWVQALVVFWVCCHNFRTRTSVWLVLTIFLLCAIGSSSVALYQFFTGSPWLPLGQHEFDQYAGRASGTIGQPNSMAGLIGMALPLLIMLMLDPRRHLGIRILSGYISTLLIIALYATGSRGGYIATGMTILAIPFFLNFSYRTRLMFFGALATVMLIAGTILYFNASFFQSRIDRLLADSGESSRREMYEVAFAVAMDQPLFGSGAGSYDLMFERYGSGEVQRRAVHTHNEYLNFLSDYGFVGLFLFFFPVILILVRAFRSWQRMPFEAFDEKAQVVSSPDSKVIAAGLLLGMFNFLVHCVVDFHLHVPALLFLFAILLGFLVRLSGKRGMPIPMPSVLLPGVYLVAGVFVFAFLPGALTTQQASALRAEAREQLDFLFQRPIRQADVAQVEAIGKSLQRARRLDSKNGDVHADLSQVMIVKAILDEEKRGRYLEDAEYNARAALELCPDFWHYHIYLAWALHLRGEPLEAVLVPLDMAVVLSPHRAQAWFYRARILKRYPEAREEVQKAILKARELDPGNPDFKRLRL